MFIFQCKDSTEKTKTVLTSNYTLTYHKRLIFAEKDMSVSQKSISWNSYTFIFLNHNHNPNTTPNPKPNPKPKPNPNPNPNPKLNTNPNAYPNPNPTSSYTFKTRCLSFKVKLLQRKGRLLSFLTILGYISNNNVSFQRKTSAF